MISSWFSKRNFVITSISLRFLDLTTNRESSERQDKINYFDRDDGRISPRVDDFHVCTLARLGSVNFDCYGEWNFST